MPTEITLPVAVRVGDTEAQWGTITLTEEDGPVTEDTIRRAAAAFFRTAVDILEHPRSDDAEEVDGAAP
ncbi:hypothetical protein ACH4JS_26485 [Streptomyces sp. NPDC017638]|uniref:hypothetical protein n=1 Tax=Streptomyces sp. NPDC017638 TaxID=3365004 RepID=UPI0037875DF0